MYLMNPVTGEVAPEQEWRDIYEYTPEEEWGGENFEDAKLIEVHWNPYEEDWEEGPENFDYLEYFDESFEKYLDN